jgi:hypothetical protein
VQTSGSSKTDQHGTEQNHSEEQTKRKRTYHKPPTAAAYSSIPHGNQQIKKWILRRKTSGTRQSPKTDFSIEINEITTDLQRSLSSLPLLIIRI